VSTSEGMQKRLPLGRRGASGSWVGQPDQPHVRTGASSARVARFSGGAHAAAACEPEYVVAAEALPGACCNAEALLALLLASIEHGHWRVALKRYLMLLACGVPVPACYDIECRRYAARCSERSLATMRANVRRWAAMVGAAGVARIDFEVQSPALPRDKHDHLHAAFRPLQ
jgi:hypothetical protein